MLSRLLPRAVEEERANWSLAQFAGLSPMSSVYVPMPVTLERAVTHAASSACIDVLATSVSTLPLDAVRMQGKTRVPVSPAPSLIGSPSALVAPDVWLYQAVDSMLTDGNVFGMVVAVDPLARPTQIELVDACTVTQRRVVDGVPQAVIDQKPHQLYPYGDLWHVPGKYVKAGSPFASSPLDRAAATIGAALAAREFGSRFFMDGGHPGGIVTADKDLTAEQAKAVKQAFVNATTGTREPAVFGSGLKYQAIMVDPNDSQFLDLMRFAIEEACRFWRVPPTMVYAATSGQNVTYANVTQADLAYLKHSLEGLLVRLETALSRLLTRPTFARFNRNAFLRADPQTRNEIYDKRLANRTLEPEEVRALEDEAPVAKHLNRDDVEMAGMLIRSGFEPEAALKVLGLPPIDHTGGLPVTVRPEDSTTPFP